MDWISCYEQLPEHKQPVIFRTDHEGVWSGRYYKNEKAVSVIGTFRAMTDNDAVIGWHFRQKKEHSEVHEWMPLPE